MDNLFAALYELITGQNDLANMLYEESCFYFTTGAVTLLISLVGMAVYYYVINHPRFSRWFHWLLVVVVICLINFAFAYFMADGVVWRIHGTTAGYVMQIVTFGLANVAWTVVYCFVFSMCLKWGSRNVKYSPF